MNPMFKYFYLLFIFNCIKDSTASIISNTIPNSNSNSSASASFIGTKTKVSSSGKNDYEKYQDILEWEAPIEMKKKFPYYFSGHDEHGNPVWVNEFGNWDMRWLSEGGAEFEPLWKKYTEQYLRRLYFSAKNATARVGESGEERPIEGFLAIIDADNFSHRQYLYPPALKKTLEFFQELFNMELTESAPTLKTCYYINVNFAGRSLWTGVSSLLGEFATKFETYGTNSNKWRHELLKDIPRESLPKKYGGVESWKRIPVYDL